MVTSALITRNEAVELSGTSAAVLNKAIEAKLVPTVKRRQRGLVRAQDVSVLTLFYYLRAIGVAPTGTQKRRLVEWARSTESEFELSEAVVVRRPAEVIRAQKATERYIDQRERFLEIDPQVQGGEPVIKGTRIPIRGLAKQIGQGETLEVLGREYDYVDPDAFEFAVRWARANPRRGRPKTVATDKGGEPKARRAHLDRRRKESAAAA